ncbi:MAG: hypothetical protein K0R48_1468 [Gammaproteobacteria bacterium]|jgi:NifU-like protein involved in Fe-S cluster formation|nr:hypothetical protein [Gammaproteobacteria bacterium]
MYNKQVLTYLHQATVTSLWPEGTAGVFSAEVGLKESGTWIKLCVYIKDSTIHEVRYRVIGGGYLIATVEWVNEYLTGKSLSTAEVLNAKFIVEVLGLPPQRFYCAQMIVDAVRKIVRQTI